MTIRIPTQHQHERRQASRQADVELGVALVIIGLVIFLTAPVVPAVPL